MKVGVSGVSEQLNTERKVAIQTTDYGTMVTVKASLGFLVEHFFHKLLRKDMLFMLTSARNAITLI